VLIDGAFGQVPAVRHKEILWALSRGVEVFGAGSLGALRAAELSGFGVKGHGFVYRWYRATPLADDDEVAVAMTPAELGSRPLGEALINMRLTFRELERLGGLQRAQRLTLERIARKIYYLERSYPRVFERARDEFPRTARATLCAAADWIRKNAIDQKKLDAVSLLRYLAQRPAGPSPRPTDYTFRLTESWLHDLQLGGLDTHPIRRAAALGGS
jgi:hypothetical protein